MRTALTIAGSDSGGGAGIQADLKTFARFGVYGTSVITAITAQNTLGVTAWEPVSTALVRAQIDAVCEDLPPAAMKTGMLGNEEIVRTVVGGLQAHQRQTPLIVDPVMVATSGDLLLDLPAVSVIRDMLIPRAHLVTPNLDETGVLLDMVPRTEADMRAAAHALVTRLGARAALVKGGHGPDQREVCDILYDGNEYTVFRHPRIASSNTHGTGCTLSAAITAHLALGRSLQESVATAITYVHRAIAAAPGLGRGHGPLHHGVV